MRLLLELVQVAVAQAGCVGIVRGPPEIASLVDGSRLTDAAGNAGLVHGEVHAMRCTGPCLVGQKRCWQPQGR